MNLKTLWSRLISSVLTDIKIRSHNIALLITCLTPLLFIIILTLLFPVLSSYIYLKTGFLLENYYTLVAISIISIIPMLFGVMYAFIPLHENNLPVQSDLEDTSAGRNDLLYMRMTFSALLCFVLTLIVIVLSKPVPSEGWLRNIFAAFLLSIHVPFVFLFVSAFSRNRNTRLTIYLLYVFFLIAVPLGLLLHHPWNYFAFFSPLYWTAWAWIVESPGESIIYGSIAVVLTAGAIILFKHFFVKKHAV